MSLPIISRQEVKLLTDRGYILIMGDLPGKATHEFCGIPCYVTCDFALPAELTGEDVEITLENIRASRLLNMKREG